MTDTPTPPEPGDDDSTEWPDAEPDDNDDSRGGRLFAGTHDDEPDVPAQLHPDPPEAS